MELRASCFGSSYAALDCRSAENSSIVSAVSAVICVREAVLADRESILALTTRLVEFGPPPWRDPMQMVAAESETLGSILASPRAGASILVAVDAGQNVVGFVHVATASDAHTRERHGQIINLAVTLGARRQGVARLLIAAAERWTCARGYRLLTMQTFAKNRAADALCVSTGFVEETITFRKSVR